MELNHITLAVTDIERSFQFYKDLLQLTPLCRWDKGAYFLAGNFWFCLNQDRNVSSRICYTHYAFSVSAEEFEQISKRIIDSKAPLFKENSSPGLSLYFLDPDGHKLEIHAGTWQARIAAKKVDPGQWKAIRWYV